MRFSFSNKSLDKNSKKTSEVASWHSSLFQHLGAAQSNDSLILAKRKTTDSDRNKSQAVVDLQNDTTPSQA